MSRREQAARPATHARGRSPRPRDGIVRAAGKTVAMMVPLILLGILMLPPFSLLLAPPQQVGLGVCIPSPVVLGEHIVGLAPGMPWRRSTMQFAAATGTDPGIVENYTLFGQPFNQARACKVTHLGAVPLIQLLPRSDSLAVIAAGGSDQYLESYARAVRAFNDPVILSFGHEMNARWWPWGYQHTSPAVFIAAWRHIWNVFARMHVRNVSWLWNVNKDAIAGQEDSISPPREWWPGGKYVNWTGIDGYFNTPADTFTSVFGNTLGSIRQFTRDPVLITETAIAPGPQQTAQIRSLFSGAGKARQVLGFVWFDLDRREAWHLESRPDALAVFQPEATAYQASPYADSEYEWRRNPRPATLPRPGPARMMPGPGLARILTPGFAAGRGHPAPGFSRLPGGTGPSPGRRGHRDPGASRPHARGHAPPR